MMNLIFDEKSIQNEQLESQVKILHSALKQQKDEHERYLKEMEKRKGVHVSKSFETFISL